MLYNYKNTILISLIFNLLKLTTVQLNKFLNQHVEFFQHAVSLNNN